MHVDRNCGGNQGEICGLNMLYSLSYRLKERIAGIGIVDHGEPGC